MANGPVSKITLNVTDVQAPGAPILSNYLQQSNTAATFDATCTSADADGSGLTGLKGLNYTTAPSGLYDGQSGDQIIAAGAAVTSLPLTDADAGQLKPGLASPILAIGQGQDVYAWHND